MNTLQASPASRKAILIGVFGLIGVMAAIALQDEVPKATPASRGSGPAVAGAQPTAAAPSAAPAAGQLAVADLPQATLSADQDREPMDLKEALAALPDHRGRLVRCRNTIESLPAATPTEGDGAAKSWSGRSLTGPYLPLYCHAAGANVRVHVRFESGTLAALPSIGRHTTVLLQLLGRNASGVVATRFIRVLARPRTANLASRGLPDLLGALIAATPQGRVDCQSAGAPELITPQAPKEGSPAKVILAVVACGDRRDLDVPILVRFAKTKALELLRVGRGTTLRLVLDGRAHGQLLAEFVALVAGAVPAEAGDLRAVLLQPETHTGTLVRCQSMGLPQPQAMASRDAHLTLPAGVELADRKAWLVCRHPAAPAVHLNLLFRAGHKHHLLAIGRGTDVHVKVLGVSGDRIDALFESVVGHPVAAATQTRDLRRLGLLTERLVGTSLDCTLVHDLDEAAADRPPRVHCRDELRPGVGQAVALQGRDAPGLVALKLPAGAVMGLKLAGFANNLPVATLLSVPKAPVAGQPAVPAPSGPDSTLSPSGPVSGPP